MRKFLLAKVAESHKNLRTFLFFRKFVQKLNQQKGYLLVNSAKWMNLLKFVNEIDWFEDTFSFRFERF